jgi:hypothetical protein
MIEESVLLISLDCLLDMRLAVLYSFGEAIVKQNLNEHYYRRQIDSFKGITKAQFDERYLNRHKGYLKNALPTLLVDFVNGFIFNTQKQSLESPFKLNPKVCVNVTPYDLTDEECDNLIKTIVAMTHRQCPIEIVSYSFDQLTPEFVNSHFSTMVMYDGPAWIEHQAQLKGFERQLCSEVTLISPRIYPEKLPGPAELKQFEQAKTDFFKALETLAGPMINLVLLPIEHFSLSLRLKQHK